MLWSPNCQLLYPFENQANDYSGNARHGTVFGSGVYATRPNAGRCLYFDGVGDYVKTPSFGLSGTVLVFAADVRCKFNATIRQEFIGDGQQSTTVGFIHLYRSEGSNSFVLRYADGTQAAYAITTAFFLAPYEDVWLHLCAVCDYSGKNTYVYRNGVLFSSIAMSGVPVFPSANRTRDIGRWLAITYPLTDGYMANAYLCTLATKPPDAQMLANANRLMLGMNPIWC